MFRRNFIKQAGLVTGGLILQNQLLQAMGQHAAADKITVGVIGCGDRGTGIMSVMNELEDYFSVTAICDVLDFRLAHAKKISIGANAKEYKDYRKLLEDKSIQAVIIATPLNMHYPIAADALAAGKHVYLEKTMTYNIPQAADLVKKVKANPKQVLLVGHQYRSTPLYFRVKEMIEKGYLGKVTQIDCRWDRNWNWRRPVEPGYTDKQINWLMYKEYSGGLPAELL
jgi:predicted dehydrogenase